MHAKVIMNEDISLKVKCVLRQNMLSHFYWCMCCNFILKTDYNFKIDYMLFKIDYMLFRTLV